MSLPSSNPFSRPRELEGYNVERLINAFHMKVENTPPYRADWKGIVEQHFRIINTKVKPFLPGTVDMDVRVRGTGITDWMQH